MKTILLQRQADGSLVDWGRHATVGGVRGQGGAFELKRAALEECCIQQQGLLDGKVWAVPDAELFKLNSQIHQLVIECSRNTFFRDNLRRIDVLRRVREFRQSIDREYAAVRCREHLQIARLLLADEREDAADLMRRHLLSVSFARMGRQEPGCGK